MADAGFLHFLAQSDFVARSVLAILLLMSIASWSLMALKAYRVWFAARQRRGFLVAYQGSPTPIMLERQLSRGSGGDARERLAVAGFAAWRRWSRRADDALMETSMDDFLDRALHRAVSAERARQEDGLAVLAAVASTAPFVGLFGTVWGIYHALLAIGISGQAGLDKVAGPVGEALTMTAVGLAVAIPAALAYNALVRAGRVTMADLEDFAHDFHAFLVTGVHGQQAGASTREAPARSSLEHA
jgi:biopolymer transport protein ExbB